eukprot:2734618-Lingulodinium_polyedra.AAC.1
MRCQGSLNGPAGQALSRALQGPAQEKAWAHASYVQRSEPPLLPAVAQPRAGIPSARWHTDARMPGAE